MIRKISVGLIALLLSVRVADAQSCGAYPYTLTNGTNADATQVMANFNAILNCLSPPRGYLYGLTLSNNSVDAVNDIDIAEGAAASVDTSPVAMVLASALTKRLDATWAVGTSAGMLDTGSVANNTYHIFLIKRPDTGVVDVLASLSTTSPTMPTNYTLKRRIGSIVRAGGTIRAFIQRGDMFRWAVPNLDVNVTNAGTAAQTVTLTIPTGVIFPSITSWFVTSQSLRTILLVTDLATPDTAPSSALFTMGAGGGMVVAGGEIVTNTNTAAQIRVRQDTSETNTVVRNTTFGWIDTRGK